MKKNLFYFFALISAMGLFTACGDDENTWEQIPQTEIAGSDATLIVNGETCSSGSAQMVVKNGSEAVLTLKNVIPGYSEVAVDVKLQEQADNSFLFTGKTGLSDPPSMLGTTKSVAKEIIFDLSVSGNITVSGKISVTTTTELTAAAQGGLVGNWKLGDFTIDEENFVTLTSAAFVKWKATGTSEQAASTISNLVSLMTSSLLAEFLNEVTFSTDGNITAKYGEKLPIVEDFGELTALEWMLNTPNITEDWSIEPFNRAWKESPKNLAFWYVKGGLLYVVPNIKNIMAQAGAGQEGTETGSFDIAAILQQLGKLGINVSDPNVQALLPQVIGWMSTGVPVKYSVADEGKLDVYIDEGMAEPFMKVIIGLLPALDDKVPDEYAGMLQALIGISKPSELSNVWNDTTVFNLGLALKK